ncbi:hypothetical protein CRM79_15800 [Pantoea agglomerans]|nr:hypothetical protein CRM79_15800 [Pantoea agglomerans]
MFVFEHNHNRKPTFTPVFNRVKTFFNRVKTFLRDIANILPTKKTDSRNDCQVIGVDSRVTLRTITTTLL